MQKGIGYQFEIVNRIGFVEFGYPSNNEASYIAAHSICLNISTSSFSHVRPWLKEESTTFSSQTIFCWKLDSEF